MIRRHTKGAGEEIHFEPALRVVSGNYVTAKRRGVVDGVDFGYTGEVRVPVHVYVFLCTHVCVSVCVCARGCVHELEGTSGGCMESWQQVHLRWWHT